MAESPALVMLIDKEAAKMANIRYQGPSPTKVQFCMPKPMMDPAVARMAKYDPSGTSGGVKQLPELAEGAQHEKTESAAVEKKGMMG